jgi:hypothetical protein
VLQSKQKKPGRRLGVIDDDPSIRASLLSLFYRFSYFIKSCLSLVNRRNLLLALS